MPDKHLSSQFDSEMNAVSSRVMELGGLVESQLRHAMYALSQFSPESAAKVVEIEATVNAMEVEIDRDISSIIGRRQPTARDLRLLMAMSKTTANLERVGDEANKIARMVYRAADVTADAKVRAQIKKLQDDGYGHDPVCVAKTQASITVNAALRGAPTDHVVNIREVRLAAGAEFVVMICGDIRTMPGLPKVPSAEKIDLVDGKVVGLF